MNILDQLSTQQVAELTDAVAVHGGIRAFAERHTLNANSIRGALSRGGGIASLHSANGLPLHASQAPVFSDALEVAAQQKPAQRAVGEVPEFCPEPITLIQPEPILSLHRWLYAADLHSPLHDAKWIERLCKVAKALDVSELVLGGDVFDAGEVSSHGDDLEAADINQALETTGQVLRYIKSHFKTIHILPGNHCRRYARRLNKDLHFKNLVQMAVGDISGFNITNRDYFLVNETTKTRAGWAVGHPRFFAQFPAKGLETIAVQRQRSVIGAHSHTSGVIRHGRFICCSPGHLMRPDLTPYLARGDGMSKHPEQTSAQGFVLVESEPGEEDTLTLFGNGLTRWSDYT